MEPWWSMMESWWFIEYLPTLLMLHQRCRKIFEARVLRQKANSPTGDLGGTAFRCWREFENFITQNRWKFHFSQHFNDSDKQHNEHIQTHSYIVQHLQFITDIKTLHYINHLQLFDTIYHYISKTLQYFAKAILSSRV